MKRQPANSEITDAEDETSEAILQVFRALGLETHETSDLLSKPNNSRSTCTIS